MGSIFISQIKLRIPYRSFVSSSGHRSCSVLGSCDLWLCWSAGAGKSHRHTAMCLCSSDRSTKSGQAWAQAWMSLMEMTPATGQWVQCRTSAMCTGCGSYAVYCYSPGRRSFQIHKWSPWLYMDMGSFCLVPRLSSDILLSKTSQTANLKPNILSIYSFRGGEGWGKWALGFGDSFSPLFTGWPSQQMGLCFQHKPQRTTGTVSSWWMMVWA